METQRSEELESTNQEEWSKEEKEEEAVNMNQEDLDLFSQMQDLIRGNLECLLNVRQNYVKDRKFDGSRIVLNKIDEKILVLIEELAGGIGDLGEEIDLEGIEEEIEET